MGRLRVVWCKIQSSKVVTPPMSIEDRSSGPDEQDWVVYWRIHDLWGPANLVASTVAELDDTLLYFTDDIGIVFEPLTDYPVRFSRWRRHYGTVGPARLFDSQCERWSLVIHVWFTCVVLSCYFPCNVTIDSNICDTIGYGWSLFVAVIL
jgi:hypothetical protein